MTLEQASKRLGVSVALVRHVAAGRRNLSADLREKIRQVFALGGGKKDVEMAGYATKQDRDEVADILGQQVRALIHAAENKPDKGAAVVAEISAALDGILAKHGLSGGVADFMATQSRTTQETISRRTLDAYFEKGGRPVPPEWAKVRGRIPQDEEIIARRKSTPRWLAPRKIRVGKGLMTHARLSDVTVTILSGKKVRCCWPEELLEMKGVRKD